MEHQPAITIRPYQPDDKAACVAAFESNVPKFFTTEEVGQFSDWLSRFSGRELTRFDDHHYYVLLSDGTVIGCGGFGYEQQAQQAVLAWGLVDNRYHKKGYGKLLFEHRLAAIRRLYPAASVLLDTTQHSYPFFEKLGFVVEKITPDYYTQGMHRYDMRLAGGR